MMWWNLKTIFLIDICDTFNLRRRKLIGCVLAIKVAKWHCRLMNSTKNKHWGHKLLCCALSVPPRQVIKTAILPSGRLVLSLSPSLCWPGAWRKRKTHTGRTRPEIVSSSVRVRATSNPCMETHFQTKGVSTDERAHSHARASSHPIVRRILIVCRMHLRPPAHFTCSDSLSVFFKPIWSLNGNNIACIWQTRWSSWARANGLEHQNGLILVCKLKEAVVRRQAKCVCLKIAKKKNYV